MDERKATAIKDVSKRITSGGTPSTKHPEYYGGNIPWLNTKEINFKPITTTETFITEQGLNNSSAKWIEANSIVVAMYGATAGKSAITKIPLTTNQACCNITVDKNKADYRFVYYSLLDSYSELENMATGAAQQNLNAGMISNFEIQLPHLPEQKAIASVLSSLDDKIDLLHRQNKSLEAMAETLFRQWFVEEAQEDWEIVCLEDVTSRITDGAHQSPPTVEFGLPMASVKDMYQWAINTDTCRHISAEDFDALAKADCRPLKHDILIAKDGSYLKHVFVVESDMDVVILSSIAILRPNGKYHPLLLATFLKLRSTRIELENIVTGAVIPRIVLKDFRKFELPLPPKDVQNEVLIHIKPIYEKCWENNRQISVLEKLRNTLLPKLISGEVRMAV